MDNFSNHTTRIFFAAVLSGFICSCQNTSSAPIAASQPADAEHCAPGQALPMARPAANLSAAPEAALAADTVRDDCKMILIPGGIYQMGSTEFDDSRPLHEVAIDSFWIDEHEVTNAQFERFVNATGYVTVAERTLDPKDFPGVPLTALVPGSIVFTPPAEPVSLNNPLQWWTYTKGANWRSPKGPGSSIAGKGNEPVVQVCFEDARAYARWAGKRLPREAEWEKAARGGVKAAAYYWGKELKPQGKWMANIFQGNFPNANSVDDGYAELAPVKSFPPNPAGLYDMDGNVWEWCSDYYRSDYYANSERVNPRGPKDSYDPNEPNVIKRVQRGGSFLCSDQYCIRYKAGSRGKGEVNSASNNLGFRCVKNAR